jgi:hypothetical protein
MRAHAGKSVGCLAFRGDWAWKQRFAPLRSKNENRRTGNAKNPDKEALQAYLAVPISEAISGSQATQQP